MDEDFQRAQLDAIHAQTESITAGIMWAAFFLACIIAPTAIAAGLWWLAGFGLLILASWLLFVVLPRSIKYEWELIRDCDWRKLYNDIPCVWKE